MFHNGTHTQLNNATGNLYINNTSTDGSVRISATSGHQGVSVRYEGAVDLYHNNTKRFETTNTGAVVTGILTATTGTFTTGITTSLRSNKISVGDDEFINVGLGSDLKIYHDPDGVYNEIKSSNGNIRIRNFDTNGARRAIYIQSEIVQIRSHTNNHAMISATAGAQIDLYYNNTKRFETTNTGAKVTGDFEITDDISLSKSGVAVALFRSTDNHSRVRIRTATDKLSQLEFGDDDDADAGEIRYDHTNDNMIFHVGSNTERLRIDSNGNLTLTGTTGNSSPRFDIKHSDADVEGEVIRISRTDVPTVRYHSIKAKHGGAVANNYISFNLHDTSDVTAQKEVMRVVGSGSALFGGLTSQVSSVDTSKLAVQGGDNNIGIIQVHAGGGETAGDLSGITFSHGVDDQTARAKGAIAFECDGTGYGHGDLCFYVDGANDNNQVASADEKVRITSDGKVGIGTQVPAGLLHISSGTSGDCELIIEADEDNNNENDNPRIVFIQDGGLQESSVGMDNNTLVLANSVSSSGGIVFKTGTTTGYTNATERMRILDSGGLTFNGDTSSANALDDYEEGTFTPSYSTSNNDIGTVDYDVRQGRYTKIGRMVYFTLRMRTDDITSVGTGTIKITGFPFTHINNTHHRAVTHNVYSAGWLADKSPTLALFIHNNSALQLYKKDFNNDSSSLAADSLNTGANDNDIRITGMYETSQ